MSNILTLTHDTHKGIVWLDDIQKKQIPFATSVALNKTAATIRDAMRANAAKKLTLRNSWTEKGISFKPATKSNLFVTVGSYDPYMQRQESGGIIDKSKRINRKEKMQGKSSFIPKAIVSSKSQIVSKTKYPSRLLRQKKYFIGKTNRGKRAVFLREKDNKLKLMMVFEQIVTVKPTLDFEKTANTLATKRYPIEFERAFEMALATARY